MTNPALQQIINKIFDSLSVQIPAHKDREADWKNCQGNVAACIIDDAGNIYGKIWGNDKLKGRRYFDVAYRKASQVWITGHATNDYEKLVFTDQINHKDFGIELPDLVGWMGGQPIQLDADTRISCGFSGFRGVTDLAIVKKAVEEAIH
jgi:glc operon protein GlcG